MELRGLSLNSSEISSLIEQSKQKEQEYYNYLIQDYGFSGKKDYSPGNLKDLLKFALGYSEIKSPRDIYGRLFSKEQILNMVEQRIGDSINVAGLEELAASIITSKINASDNTKTKEEGKELWSKYSGYLTELISIDKLARQLKNSGVSNIAIVDTQQSVGNGEDVKFDFVLGIQLGKTPGANGSNLVNKIPFEVKSGIKEGPEDSKFDFGQFSTKAFSNRKKVYDGLKFDIEIAVFDAIINETFFTYKPYIEIKQEELSRLLAVEYIVWRLRNNIPFFINDKNVLLCSEVLEYMNSRNKTFITTDLQDFKIDDILISNPETDELEIDQDKIYYETLKQLNKFNVAIGYGRLHN